MSTDALQQAEQLVRTADPKGALAALTQAVKAAPAKASLRIFMAQLLCVLGQWERAHTQLNVVADLQADAGPMREMVGHALRCELLRKAVFDGKRSPMIFGQPEQWLALLIESLITGSHELAAKAFDEAPTRSGQLNGERFEWLADADSRLGPVLEAMVNGRYYWVPFASLSKIVFEPPVDLRDRVWMPATLSFANGGEAVAMVPTRYAGTEALEDGQLLMAVKTEWREIGPERFAGYGQRVLVTDAGEYDLLNVKLIEFD
ncbi:MAG: tetratricopeptide repeat protein [Paucibacter sp.]|nr:tetratricopeptide repeat protein [Roseateles sp.]